LAAATQLDAGALQSLAGRLKAVCERHGRPLAAEPEEQLRGAIAAACMSWHSEQAAQFRQANGMPAAGGVAVTLQARCFCPLHCAYRVWFVCVSAGNWSLTVCQRSPCTNFHGQRVYTIRMNTLTVVLLCRPWCLATWTKRQQRGLRSREIHPPALLSCTVNTSPTRRRVTALPAGPDNYHTSYSPACPLKAIQ
jgi:hypothetical protein